MTAKLNIRKQIESMSKEELLILLGRMAFVSERDVRSVKAEGLYRKANRMATEAMENMGRLHGPENYHAYKRENAKWHKAMGFYDKAGAILQMV